MADSHYDYEQIIREGEAASQILQNPIFLQAVQEVSQELVLQFYQCRADHTKEMVEIRRQGNALAAVTGRLRMKLERAINAQQSRQLNQSGE